MTGCDRSATKTCGPARTTLLLVGVVLGMVLLVGAVGSVAAGPDCGSVSYTDDDGVYLVETLDQLQCIGSQGLGADYRLTVDIDASDTESWNGGDGFEPIEGFTGSFDGDGHSITGLYINRAGRVGMFGTGTGGDIENVNLVDVDVTGE